MNKDTGLELLKKPLCNCVLEVESQFVNSQDEEQESMVSAARYFKEISGVVHRCTSTHDFHILADNDVEHYIDLYNTLTSEEFESKRNSKLKQWRADFEKTENLIKESTGSLSRMVATNYWRFYNSRLHVNLLNRVDFGKVEPARNIFDRELQLISSSEFPFKHLFFANEQAKEALFSQFVKTARKPNFKSFALLFVSSQEHELGCLYGGTKYESRHSRIYAAFNELIASKKLPENLMTNDLELTSIVKECRAINQRMTVLRKSVFDIHLDKYKEAEIEAANVQEHLNNLDSSTREILCDELISDDYNLYLFLAKDGIAEPKGEFSDRWVDIKGKFNSLLRNAQEQLNGTQKTRMNKSKLDFTYGKLEPIVIDLANLMNYQKPSVYLDELKVDVEAFNSVDFKGDFYLNVHHICQRNASLFQSEVHRKDITRWLHSSGLGFHVFNTTWDGVQSAEIKCDKINGIEIRKYLNECENAFQSKADYEKAIELIAAFLSKKPLKISKPIFVRNGNIKSLAFALGQVWVNSSNEPISYEYLLFYKKAFSIFSKQKFDKSNVKGMPLYKYSMSKT